MDKPYTHVHVQWVWVGRTAREWKHNSNIIINLGSVWTYNNSHISWSEGSCVAISSGSSLNIDFIYWLQFGTGHFPFLFSNRVSNGQEALSSSASKSRRLGALDNALSTSFVWIWTIRLLWSITFRMLWFSPSQRRRLCFWFRELSWPSCVRRDGGTMAGRLCVDGGQCNVSWHQGRQGSGMESPVQNGRKCNGTTDWSNFNAIARQTFETNPMPKTLCT